MESENRFEKNGRRSRPVCRSKLESEVFKYALRFRFIWGDCESLTVRQTRRTGCAPRVIFADEIFRRLCIHRIHLSRVPCIICYWWIISPSVFHECLSNETRYVCFRVRRALRNIPRFFAKTPRLPFFNQNYNRFEIIPRSSSDRSILIQVRFITNRNFNRDFTSTVIFARNYLFSFLLCKKKQW